MIEFFKTLSWGDVFLGFVAYFCTWWVVLFMTLPLYVEKQTPEEIKNGIEEAAPRHHNMKRKMIITSFVALIPWALIHYLLLREGFNFREWILAF